MLDAIEAVFEDGVFRPDQPVIGLAPGQRVWVSVEQPREASQSERKEAALIRSLEDRGLVEKTAAPPAPADFRPLQMPGPGLSETILAERR